MLSPSSEAFTGMILLTIILHRRLRETQPSHALLADIQEKSEFFDAAAAKYSAKVSS